MIRFSTLSLAAALAAAITAAPALAQSFNPRDGTGNVLPVQYQADGGRNAWIEARPNVQVAARTSGAVQGAARPNGSVQIGRDTARPSRSPAVWPGATTAPRKLKT